MNDSVLQALANTANTRLRMGAKTFGKHLRELREHKGVSLRNFAQRLEISPAFLVDLEKDRRRPSSQMVQRIADELDVPASAFEEFSLELPKAVREWADQDPVIGSALKMLTKLSDPRAALASLEVGQASRRARRFVMAIYESELQAMGLESTSWDSETGGDLFGIWGEIPIVYLATRSGPRSVRDQAHFRLDVDYLIKLSVELDATWGLRYFGDWHSHHRLGLATPSTGDRSRIQRVAQKNHFLEMAEFIVTFSSSYEVDGRVHVHPYAYVQLPSDELTDVVLVVLTGVSPVREALTHRGSLPEQQIKAFSSFALDRVIIPKEPLPRVPGSDAPATKPISDRVIRRAVAELESATSSRVEVHETAFGYVFVVPLTPSQHIAFAIDGAWPHRVLEVDRLDRGAGTSEELPISTESVSLMDPGRVTELLSAATRGSGGIA